MGGAPGDIQAKPPPSLEAPVTNLSLPFPLALWSFQILCTVSGSGVIWVEDTRIELKGYSRVWTGAPMRELMALVLTKVGSGGCEEDRFVVCAYLGPSLNLQHMHITCLHYFRTGAKYWKAAVMISSTSQMRKYRIMLSTVRYSYKMFNTVIIL